MKASSLPTFAAITFAIIAVVSVSGLQRPAFAAEEGATGCPGIHPPGKCCHCAYSPTECTTVDADGYSTCQNDQPSCPPRQGCKIGGN